MYHLLESGELQEKQQRHSVYLGTTVSDGATGADDPVWAFDRVSRLALDDVSELVKYKYDTF